MQEEYLHYLWRLKRFNFNQFFLANLNHSKISVEETGWYNLDAGPDFFNGCAIIDGMKWFGNIELHIKSSDWYLHQHHLDSAYDNVILHVVYEYDKKVIVNGKELPTIELKNQIDRHHFKQYSRILKNAQAIPCGHQLKDHLFALHQQIDISFLNRIERKGLELLDNFEIKKVNKNMLFLFGIFQAIGGKTNKIPMQELAHRISFLIFEREKWDKLRVEALLFGCAGLLKGNCVDDYFIRLQNQWELLKSKHKLTEMNQNTWKFGGIRPPSFPTLLLAQLSAFLFQFEWEEWERAEVDELKKRLDALSAINIHPYWKTHFVFGKPSKSRKLSFNRSFISNMVINGIVPVYVALKHFYNDYSYTEKAMDLMSSMPAEQNSITKEWQKVGFLPKNALESQGIIELKNEFCNFKKCLSCKVGCGILEK